MSDLPPIRLRPIRQKSLRGKPAEPSKFLRACANCGASFRAEGGDKFRGLWNGWSWFCSQECYDAGGQA